MSTVPDPAFLIRRLITLAEREREALMHADENWDEVIASREDFDSEFARLEMAVSRRPLTPNEVNDLARLQHIHTVNIEISLKLQEQYGAELADINKVRKISGYKPLGDTPNDSSRYLDSSA